MTHIAKLITAYQSSEGLISESGKLSVNLAVTQRRLWIRAFSSTRANKKARFVSKAQEAIYTHDRQ